MPDRLGDFLENSEPSRHKMFCPKCGEVIRANTAVGVRFAMRNHRKHTCPKRGQKAEEEMPDEPPEEFDRDAVGDPEDFDAMLARELADMLESEQIDELEDDMLLDRVGQGDDNRTIYDEYDEVEDTLEDHLHDIKEQPEDEPIPELVSTEEAMKIIAEAKKKYEEKKAAEGRDTAKGEEVPISDDAQRIAQIGNNEEAIGALAGASQDIDNAKQALSQAAEALGTAVQKMQSAAEKAGGDAAEAGGLLGGSEGENIRGQGLTVAEQIGNAMQHIGQIDLAAAEASLQQANLEGVGNQTQALYQAIKDAASRHQG